MRVVVITPPDPVVSWEEARDHLRLDGDDEQALVDSMIAAATQHIDGPAGWLGRAIGVQTLEARMCGFCDIICLPYRPVIEIVSVHYLDGAGQPQLVDADVYELFGHELGAAWGKSWPTPGAYRGQAETVRIRYRAGYETIPAPIKAAILLMVGDMFAFREGVQPGGSVASVPMSTTVENLLSPFRVWC